VHANAKKEEKRKRENKLDKMNTLATANTQESDVNANQSIDQREEDEAGVGSARRATARSSARSDHAPLIHPSRSIGFTPSCTLHDTVAKFS
jgi:hypothetical protein